MIIAAVAQGGSAGLDLGLVVAAFAFGLRHGIDWDHIAAITDITASQDSRRAGAVYGTLYALGHAIVVFILGVVAILIGKSLPEAVDEVMGRVVGVTLIALGVYVFYALIRYRGDFRMRSRWMLVFAGLRRTFTWISSRFGSRAEDVEHEHSHVAADDYHHQDEGSHGDHHQVEEALIPTHAHRHRHPGATPFVNYGKATSVLVGMLHGVGAETPTQVLIFLAAAGAGGAGVGILVLSAFLVGLFTSNSIITLGSTLGFVRASGQFGVYATLAVVTGAVSLVVGTLFLFGKPSVLPAIFGG